MSGFKTQGYPVPQRFVQQTNHAVKPKCCQFEGEKQRAGCETCGFFETPLNVPYEQVCNPLERGWTAIGVALSRDYAPKIDYLTKSCQECDLDYDYSCCNGCRSNVDLSYLESMGNEPFYPEDGTSTPFQYRYGNNPYAVCKDIAFQRKTMWTNYGIGYGKNMPECGCFPENAGPRAFTSNGMRYGQLHQDGKGLCQSQDPFYHPAVSVVTAPLRRFTLYARATQCGTSRFSYAVAPMDVKIPILITLSGDPRQAPWSNCNVGYINQSIYQIVTGDRIYIPGQPGSFLINLYVDNTVPYRPNASVFRGYSPVRPLAEKKFISNSGLRNFSSHPSANGLLRPF